MRGNDEQQAQRCANSVHVNHVAGGLRPAAGQWTLLRRRLPRRHRRPEWPIQTRRSPQSAKCLRARPSCIGSSSIRKRAGTNRSCTRAIQRRSIQRSGAKCLRVSAIAGEAIRNSAGRQPRNEIFAAAFDRRILRAADSAPQFRREIRRLRLSRSGLPVLLGLFACVMRFMRRDHFLRDFIRHVIVMGKFHRITSAPLRQRNQFIRVTQHF